jgi:hypothetical protein
MGSSFFKIEVYDHCNFGCPELDLMGYNDIELLMIDCWRKYKNE